MFHGPDILALPTMFKILLPYSHCKSILFGKKYSLDLARLFSERGIPTKVVLDAAVGAVMEEVDLCLVGAEGVMENGGIVNKVPYKSMLLIFLRCF